MQPGTVVRRARTAYALFAALVAVVLLVILLLVGLGAVWAAIAAVLVAGSATLALYLTADRLALRAVGARPVDAGEMPHLENLVQGLAVAHGFRLPQLCLIDDAAPNALVVGRTPRHGALAVTSGLLERLERIQLEGVLAHELSRIRSRETFAAVTAATLVCRPLGFSERIAGTLASRLLDPQVAVRADLTGAGITRYPPGLAGALMSLRADGRTVKTNPRAYRHLWFDPPAGVIAELSFSLDDRIDVLHEL